MSENEAPNPYSFFGRVEDFREVAPSMENPDYANQARLKLQVIYPNVFKAGDGPASKSLELWAIEKLQRPDVRPLRNLLNGCLNRGGKSLSGLVCKLVDVIADLKNNVPAGRGAEDNFHARFLRFASRAVASVFRSDQNF